MTRKRSFFERLTGSVSFDETEEVVSPPPVETKSETNWLADEEEGELAVDVYQTSAEIVIKAMISGVRPEDLNISINRETVTIKGKREPGREVNPEDYFQKELYWGAFSRTILLPAEIEVEEAEALEKHGLLTIRLPKIDKHKIQNLKVKSV